VVVAMSGGVDSSVCAALLAEQGHEVVGVHMKLHDRGPSTATAGQCCGLDDALDARRVADHIGFPFYVVDLRDAFRAAVMDNFASDYARGRTPNPCVRCNGVLKFRVLMARALALGADALATGHYARIVDGRLAAAADPDKDQSYFLFPMTRAALDKTLFPLGELTKSEVRGHAARLGLPVAHKAESQEVCFIPDDDHTAFVRQHLGPEVDAAGPIVDESGRELGRHDAFYRYTVGQRRGLNVALGTPAYVLRIEPESRAVVVTTEPERLGSLGLVATGSSWHAEPAEDETVAVRVRHRGRLHPARIAVGGDGTFAARFDAPVRAVTPGQAAVVYRGDTVLGGGWIEEAK
jgi:tRNA-uridine 2-sulfurtransferase